MRNCFDIYSVYNAVPIFENCQSVCSAEGDCSALFSFAPSRAGPRIIRSRFFLFWIFCSSTLEVLLKISSVKCKHLLFVALGYQNYPARHQQFMQVNNCRWMLLGSLIIHTLDLISCTLCGVRSKGNFWGNRVMADFSMCLFFKLQSTYWAP